jgi:hypothetical protein
VRAASVPGTPLHHRRTRVCNCQRTRWRCRSLTAAGRSHFCESA